MKTILRSNLELALKEAIRSQKEYEYHRFGMYYESCLVAGWKEILEALQNGEKIIIND